MQFQRVDPGSFLMGSPADEPGHEEQEVRHRVTLTKPYWLGRYEVTQGEWRSVMGSAPSWFRGDDRRPVENVTWFEVAAFVDALNRTSERDVFRLPTEAEWEYACRAGVDTPYLTGATLDGAQANIALSAERAAAGEGAPRAVGSYAPNGWGFHDMHGNVWEWTSDEHCPYPSGVETDPVRRCNNPLKVIRGGSFYFGADSARCGLRYTHRPFDRGFSLGVRLVREPREG